MNLKREIGAAIHGQSKKFRTIKYSILIPLLIIIFLLKSWSGVFWFLGIAIIAALIMHLFYRNKTKAWTKSWGGYKAK